MAADGLWVKGRTDQFNEEYIDEGNGDAWDDSALIEAYDRAVNSFKNSLKDKSKIENIDSRRSKQKGDSKQHHKKSKTHTNRKWKIGDKCQAIYYEDGLLYDGEIIDIQPENGSCIVRFDYYENEEMVAFDEIFQIHQTDPDTNGNKRKSGGNVKHRNNDENTEYGKKNHISSDEERNTINGTVDEQGSNDLRNGDLSSSWTVGDVCLAPDPQTGTYEEAVIVYVDSDSCTLTFTRSRIKTRVETSILRPQFKKKKHCGHTCKHQRNEEMGFENNWTQRFPDHNDPPPDFFTQPFIPPPPPPIGMPFHAENDDALASMLMSWYMVGYHTGYYQGLRSKQAAEVASKQHGSTNPVDSYSERSSKPDI